MRRTGVKKYSSKLITNGKCTFDHVPCGFGFLMGEREDLPCCLGPLLLMLLSVVPLVTPTLIVLPSGLLLGTILLLQWLGCWGNLMDRLSSNWSWGSRQCRNL
ncbi:hypothetical protein AAC387_Pa07g2109 [Persea americana]